MHHGKNEKRRVYAVIDTNVLVSSIFSRSGESNPAQVIRCVLNGTIIPVYNAEIIDEYYDVLLREKFHFNEQLVRNLIDSFKELGVRMERTKTDGEFFADTDDVVFYEICLSIDEAYLVTGNIKHFPKKPFVVTPAQMMEILRELEM